MKVLVLLATVFASGSVLAAQRVAERYTCAAFNPLTGYATITFNEKTKARGARMTSLAGEQQLHGGRLTYNSSSYSSYPRAVFSIPVKGGDPIQVYMDLLRPLNNDDCEGKLSEEILSGITYIPLFGVAPGLSLFAPLSGYGTLPLVPVPAGFVPTSVVTCRVIFREIGD